MELAHLIQELDVEDGLGRVEVPHPEDVPVVAAAVVLVVRLVRNELAVVLLERDEVGLRLERVDGPQPLVRVQLLDQGVLPLRLKATLLPRLLVDEDTNQIVCLLDNEITGLELDLLWALTPNLIFSLSGGWLDTEIGEFFTVDTANPNASSAAALAADPTVASQGLVSVNGVNFVAAPDYSRCEVAAPSISRH